MFCKFIVNKLFECIIVNFINAFIGAKDIVLEILIRCDCDDRTNIYIGVTGILVAIVIFIAEIITNKKHEIYKKLILKKTKVIKNVKFMIIVLGMIWISNIFEKKEQEVLYILTQIIINCSIIYSMYKTLKLFTVVIKLNTNETYMNEELDSYIQEEIFLYKKNKKNKENKYKELKEQFLNYIENSDIFGFKEYVFDIDEEYKTIYPNENGYIERYDYNLLDYITNYTKTNVNVTNSINESKIKDGKIEKTEVILCKMVGEKVNKRLPIAYYKNLSEDLVNNIKKSVIIDKKEMYTVENVTKIVDDLFEIANEDKLNYDSNNKLINFYEFLCKDRNDDIIGIFINKIEKNYFEVIKNIEYNKSFSEFLTKLLHISYRYNQYDKFKTFNSYITGLYYKMMKEENIDLKLVAYDYANHVFNRSFYSIKRKTDYRYYDNIMSNLLNLMNGFVKKGSIESINVLFDNIHFEDINNRYCKEISEYDIVKFQFLIGFICMILYSYNALSELNLIELKKILEQMEDKFFLFYDIWDIIYNFRKYSEKNSEIKEQIDNFEFYNESHKYKNSWFGTHIDIDEVLKCLLYIFDVQFVNLDNIKEEDIDRNDRFDFEKIRNLFSDHKYEKIEKVFGFDKYDISKVNQVLDIVIGISNEKEEKYKREEKLEEEKIDKFKKLIIEKSKEKTGILEAIYELNKVKYSNKKLKRVFGINQLIPREIFLKDVGGIEAIAEDYGRAFPRGMNKELIENIESYSRYTNESFEDVIKKMQNLDDYILIINFHNLYRLKFTREGDYLKINNHKIRVIKTNSTDKIIIIKKSSLPEIEFCGFDESYDIENIFGNLYYELQDCSNNAELRNKIIEETAWIKEKGNKEEQINYMKQQCEFKAFMSYQIINPTEIDSTIIDIEKE